MRKPFQTGLLPANDVLAKAPSTGKISTLTGRAPLTYKPQLTALTGLRTVLIAWVVLYHLQPELSLILPFEPLLSLAAVGFVGVDFFFLLSGFVIAYNYAERLFPFSFKRYRHFLGMRLARLYPVHIFSLLLVILIVASAKVVGLTLARPDYYSFSSLVQNLLLVQSWSLQTEFSWNPVAWAVSCEWLAYLIFPLIAVSLLRIRSTLGMVGTIIALLWGMSALCLWLNSYWQAPYGAGSYGLIRMAGEFSAGCLLYSLYDAGRGKRWNWSLISAVAWVAVVVVTTAIAAYYQSFDLLIEDNAFQLRILWLTPLYAFALYALTWQRGPLAKFFSTKWTVAGAHISYSLYLTHFICLIVLRRLLPVESFAASNLGLRLMILLAYCLAIVVVGTLTYHVVEKPGHVWMKRRLSKKTP